MRYAVIADPLPRFPQAPAGCAIACAAMATRHHRIDPVKLDRYLRNRLRPDLTGGVSFNAVARELRKLGFAARSGVAPLESIVGLAAQGGLVLGVRPAALYVGVSPDAHHAVYVSRSEHPLDNAPWVSRRWRTPMQFDPPLEIIDPEPGAPARHTWTHQRLAEAHTGHYLFVADTPRVTPRAQPPSGSRGRRGRSLLVPAIGAGVGLAVLALASRGR